MARTTDERLDHVERVLDAQMAWLGALNELLVALNEKADRQTAQLEAIVAQLRLMHEGIIRAHVTAERLSAAARLDALEGRILALERRS
jgi:uncharacterized coiled-coil protein SlyX